MTELISYVLCLLVIKEMEEVSLDSETDYVIYGSKAAVHPDRTHELVLEKKLWEMKEALLAQVNAGDCRQKTGDTDVRYM
jgi:hypothetical protein